MMKLFSSQRFHRKARRAIAFVVCCGMEFVGDEMSERFLLPRVHLKEAWNGGDREKLQEKVCFCLG
jgi:hypothetical protein